MTTLLGEKIKDSIYRARDYLFGKLGEDNLWRDFRTNTHGEGVDWPTAIIGNCLLVGEVKKNELEKTAEELSQRQQENGGWAFCLEGSYAYIDNKTACDTDSTSAVVLFLSNWKDKYEDKLEKAKEFLLKHQKENGGFSTYIPEEIRRYRRISKDISVDGWCRDHPDVTASVILALDKLGEKEAAKKGREYLTTLINNGRLPSYWWSSPLYVKVKSQEVFNRDKTTIGKISELPSNELDELSDFNESLYHEYFIRIGKSNKVNVDYLLRGQDPVGFWKGSNLLVVPHPSIEFPWEHEDKWRENISDQNNLITTSQVYKTLSMYLQSIRWWRK